jgi:ATP-dependent Zn protease
MTDIRCTAYHEAGHAVIAYRLGYQVEKASIIRRRGTLGRVHVQPRTSPDDIKINLAGQLAEALVNANGGDIQLGSIGDWQNARRNARKFVDLGFIGRREKDVLIEELLHDTRALVHRDREAIAAVAEALLERKTLTGDDIRRIMEALQ